MTLVVDFPVDFGETYDCGTLSQKSIKSPEDKKNTIQLINHLLFATCINSVRLTTKGIPSDWPMF